MSDQQGNRELTAAERQLVQWMLEHGTPEARQFLPQLERARVTSWRCSCGCASISFRIDGQPEPVGGMRSLADFQFASDSEFSGIFVYEQGGILSGIEVHGVEEAPKTLPSPEMLRPYLSQGFPSDFVDKTCAIPPCVSKFSH